MIDTTNHSRASAALLIYKTATRRFIARALKTQNGGTGDWFADLVLPSLSGPTAEHLKQRVEEATESGVIVSRGGQDDDGPERFLEEAHFPHIVKENWDAFRYSLRDRNAVLKRLRQIKGYRNDVVAHNNQPVSEDQVTDITQACQAVVELFDSSASDQLGELLTTPEVLQESSDSVSEVVLSSAQPEALDRVADLRKAAIDAGAPSGCPPSDEARASGSTEGGGVPRSEEGGAWQGVLKFERERRRRAARLDRLLRQFVQAGEAQYQIEELKDTLEELGTESEQDLDDSWSELHSLRWLTILPELVAQVIEESGGFDTVANSRDGEVGFYAEGSSKSVDLKIILEVRDR